MRTSYVLLQYTSLRDSERLYQSRDTRRWRVAASYAVRAVPHRAAGRITALGGPRTEFSFQNDKLHVTNRPVRAAFN